MNYDRTSKQADASRLFNFDSQLVLKWLRGQGEEVDREEVEDNEALTQRQTQRADRLGRRLTRQGKDHYGTTEGSDETGI